MPSVQIRDLKLEYESFGNPEHPTVLLIMGLGGQLTYWPEPLCARLCAEGLHVIRYDNRDIGLSSWLDHLGVPNMTEMITAALSGQAVSSPYSLSDMAADGMGLLEALNCDKAHIVGASMGGMIAQLMAAEYPERVLSLTSIMSTTGNPALPPARPEAMAALMAPAPDPSDMEAAIAQGMKVWQAIGSPAYMRPDDELRLWIGGHIRRSYHPAGTARQMAAIMADGDRRARLASVKAPTVVIHGQDDPLVPVEGGKDTAECIANADLRIIEKMGHDLPEALLDEIADGILSAVKRGTI